MNKMRVLYLTNCPAPYRVKFFNELTKYCELTVVFEMDHAKNREDKWKSDEKYKFTAVHLKSLYCRQESALCPSVVKYLKDFKDDIIVVGGYSTPTGMLSIIYMNMHRIPYILNCDGGMVKDDSKLKYHIKKYFIGSAFAWLSTGEMCKQYLLHYGATEDRIYCYPFTSVRQNDIRKVDSNQKVELRRQLAIKENKMILFVGSFIYRKGLDILLEACYDMEDVALVLVGGDEIKEFLPNLTAEQKCKVYIEGFKTETEVKKYYRAADIFVLPTREDIWGLVVNEAMAVGLPVITTDQCGAGVELIRNGVNGYCIENIERLKTNILYLMDDECARVKMAENSISTSKNYTIERMAEVHNTIFKSVKMYSAKGEQT